MTLGDVESPRLANQAIHRTFGFWDVWTLAFQSGTEELSLPLLYIYDYVYIYIYLRAAAPAADPGKE